MAHVEATHINAYLNELAEAEQAELQATARVADLKAQINQKLAEDGQPPMFDAAGKRRKQKTAKEPVPPEASGFGAPRTESGGNK